MDDLDRYYQVLGLAPGASSEEIRQAYKDLIQVWHPDRFANNPALQRKAEAKTKEINWAYTRLRVYQPGIGPDGPPTDMPPRAAPSESERAAFDSSETANPFQTAPPPESARTVRRVFSFPFRLLVWLWILPALIIPYLLYTQFSDTISNLLPPAIKRELPTNSWRLPDMSDALDRLKGWIGLKGRTAPTLPSQTSAPTDPDFKDQNPTEEASLDWRAARAQSQGRYGEAEALSRQALEMKKRAWGPNHPEAVESLNILANACKAQGKYVEAERLFKQAQAICEKALGLNHPKVAPILHNLASLYKDQGRYAEAESLYKRALTVKENAYGPNDPSVAKSLNNLAELYGEQGKNQLAESYYKQALYTMEKTQGKNHPNVAIVLESMAEFYRKKGEPGEARRLEARAQRIRSKNR